MRLLLVLLLVLPGCVSAGTMRRAQARYELGVAYYREGNVEGAITSLRDAVKADPRNWRARNALAVAYIAKGEAELAEQSFEAARRINPKEAEVLVNYGAFLTREGRHAEAIETLRLALDDLDYRNPAMVLSNLAYAELKAGETEEALMHAREAVRRVPAMCEAWFHLGMVQEARNEVDAALEAYAELARTCPAESAGARMRTGCLQVQGPVPEIGVDTLQAVMADVPNTPVADEARACLRAAGR